MQATCVCLRRSYIIAAAQVFYVNKFKKLRRITQYHRVFQKVEKTHGHPSLRHRANDLKTWPTINLNGVQSSPKFAVLLLTSFVTIG